MPEAVKRTPTGEKQPGTLYSVATPIGNLEDLTFRALRVMKQVSLIAAESVSRTRGLCRHYGIGTKVIRYNQHNSVSKGPELIKRLKAGEDIALVTDAGTPGISDPGGQLVEMVRAEGIGVIAIPGPSALTAALSVCGMPTDRFVFVGFLPGRAGKRRKELDKLRTEPRTMVFFEAPHRIAETLADMHAAFGDRHMMIARELTKTFEQVLSGRLKSILDRPEDIPTLGEFTIVAEGATWNHASGCSTEDLGAEIDHLLACGKGAKEAAQILSRKTDLPYRRIYKECLARLRGFQGVH